jgi:alpha 1,2-mannosyltransferase
MNLVGFNVERVLWGYMVEVACNDWEFMDWGRGNKSRSGMCRQGRECFRDIFEVEYDCESESDFGG